MPRCDAYSRLTNSRCTSEGTRSIVASDHDVYCVCKTHAVKVWTTEVAHWHSDTDLRRTVGPVEVRAANPPVPAFAWAS